MNGNNMQAAALYGKQDLWFIEAGLPQIDDGDILVQVKDLITSLTALGDIQTALDNITKARSLKSAIYFE